MHGITARRKLQDAILETFEVLYTQSVNSHGVSLGGGEEKLNRNLPRHRRGDQGAAAFVEQGQGAAQGGFQFGGAVALGG